MADNLSASEALNRLVEGNNHYRQKSKCVCEDVDKKRAEMVDGQKPYAVIVGCSDSRVPPEIIFNECIGDLFVIRIAGNVISQEALASIEYAVENLAVNLVMVLGHSSCGAVTAALSADRAKQSSAMRELLSLIDVPQSLVPAPGKEIINKTVLDNVAASVKFLQNYFESKFRGTNRKMKMVGGFYHLDSGEVDLMEI